MIEKKTNVAKGPWTKQEDDKLLSIIRKYGPKEWVKIASIFESRCGKQCRERWHNHLRPDINKEPLTEWEEEYILKQQKKHGNKWSLIAKGLPGRTDNIVKNFYNSQRNRKGERKPRKKSKSSNTQYMPLANKTIEAPKVYMKQPFKQLTMNNTVNISPKNEKNLDVLADIATRCYYKYVDMKDLTNFEMQKYPKLAVLMYKKSENSAWINSKKIFFFYY